MKSNLRTLLRRATLLALATAVLPFAQKAGAAAVKPLRALLITGGCCHDYATQKDVLKKGLEARAHVVVDQIHTDDKSTRPPLAIFGNPDYAKGYDVVIHDECAAAIADAKIVEGVLAPHRNGIPGVNLHCAMHSYRVGNHREPVRAGTPASLWFDYLGVQSSAHGPKEPIEITFSSARHPAIASLTDWKTGKEELYNNVQVFPATTPLATGRQIVPQKKGDNRTDEAVVVWVNTYRGTRVFSTTLGHNNETVEDPRYLDLVTRGLLWACDKPGAEYLKR